MKLNVMQKILVGYVLGFLLLLAFATLTLLNGNKIEATTITLSQEKIPGLIAASSLANNAQEQTIQLYELYATNNHAVFQKQHNASMVAMQHDMELLKSLKEYEPFELPLVLLSSKQIELSNKFVQTMKQPEVDWDAARVDLAAFSKSADDMRTELDNLVKTVSTQTLARAKTSQRLTEQLINVGLVLAALIFIGVLGIANYTHRQVVIPLREVSVALAGITSRRDLTYRLKQHNPDEVGDIVVSANHLLEEFQKLARTLDGTAQEVNRTMNNLTELTEDTRSNMVERNLKLRIATQDFMNDIGTSGKENGVAKEIDMELHRAQIKFIQTHLAEIDEGKQVTDNNVSALKAATNKLHHLAENMQSQIRLLNF